MMYDRGAYQSGVPVTPVGMADFECARVQVWVPGKGWFDRPAEWDVEPVEVAEDECSGAA